jgi:hypothetical protein
MRISTRVLQLRVLLSAREVSQFVEGGRETWISLFAIVIAVAICLSVAAAMMPSNQPR